MSKIKEIQERFAKSTQEYNEIRFLVAKRTLAFFLMFYYITFLFTIGGFSFGPFSLDVLGALTYHIYTILIIVIGWFLFELAGYVSQAYGISKMQTMLLGGICAVIFVLGNLFTHLSPSF